MGLINPFVFLVKIIRSIEIQKDVYSNLSIFLGISKLSRAKIYNESKNDLISLARIKFGKCTTFLLVFFYHSPTQANLD